jgi:hypothetical protein
MSKVVHVNKEPYDVYIGRPSKWGNPYTHIVDKETLAEFIVDSREEAISKYREYLTNNDELMGSIMELDGKTLGCWCIQDSNNPPYPYVCHGQVIQEIITSLKFKHVLRNTRKPL